MSGGRWNVEKFDVDIAMHCIGNQARLWLSKLSGDISIKEVGIIYPPPSLCVEIGFTRTFPKNQDVSVKLKSELIL